MKTIESINEYFDKEYNNKRFKDKIYWKIRTSFFINKTRNLLKDHNLEFRNWIDKEYYSSLYINWQFINIDRIHLKSNDLNELYDKSIQWIEKHFKK